MREYEPASVKELQAMERKLKALADVGNPSALTGYLSLSLDGTLDKLQQQAKPKRRASR